MKARISLVTLAVTDVERATVFYARLGWPPSSASAPGVSFFDLDGLVLALWARAEFADDLRQAGLPEAGAVALAQNQPDRASVDAVLAEAVAAGGTLRKAGAPTPWGGYAGYFADPDGHLWEIAYNPFWPLDREGRLRLPV